MRHVSVIVPLDKPSAWTPRLTSVQDHADKDDAQEKVEMEVALVLMPFEAVPRVGTGAATAMVTIGQQECGYDGRNDASNARATRRITSLT